MNSFGHFLLRVPMILFGLLPLTACATLVGVATEGQVLEEGSEKPVPDAIVVVRWAGSLPAFAHAQSVCVHVQTATTDNEGRYHTKAWSAPSTVGPAPIVQANVGPSAYAYKPGYEYVDTQGETVYLKPFTGGRGERLHELDRVVSSTSCGSAGSSYRNLYRIRQAVYHEAQSLARLDEERKRAHSFRQLAEETLVNRTKPTKYDAKGRLVNVDPSDTFKPEDLK